MDTSDRTYAEATAALSLLSALEAQPVRTLRPDGRYELRYLEIVLMEAPDRGEIKRIEYYQIDPADGLEMFQGYLNDARCPRRVELLRLWQDTFVASLPKVGPSARRPPAPLPLSVAGDLRMAHKRLQWGGWLDPIHSVDQVCA